MDLTSQQPTVLQANNETKYMVLIATVDVGRWMTRFEER
jgi:hypothetical protein